MKNNAELVSEHDSKYYMNFDFYFKRTSFRTMTLYFKTAFKPFFEQWKSDKKKVSISVYLTEFSRMYFHGLFENLNETLKEEFVEMLKLLVFSHRHNKNDAYL